MTCKKNPTQSTDLQCFDAQHPKTQPSEFAPQQHDLSDHQTVRYKDKRQSEYLFLFDTRGFEKKVENRKVRPR